MKVRDLMTLGMFLVLAGSCQPKRETPKVYDMTYETITKQDRFWVENDSTKPGSDLSITFTYPTGGIEANKLAHLQESIIVQTFGEEYAEQDVNTVVDKFIADYRATTLETLVEVNEMNEKFKEEDPEMADRMAGLTIYQYMLSDSILYAGSNIVSIRTDSYQFTGGAHGMSSTQFAVIHLTDGKILKEEDIFQGDYIEPLKKILTNKLLEQNQVKSVKELLELGYIEVESIGANSNFYLNDKGITYIYNPYEIACYALGMTELFVPYEELQFLMKKESPIAPLLND